MKAKILFIVLLVTTGLSCAQMFNATVMPNQCKRCELVNNNNGRVLWKKEGCGGENTYILRDCKIEAYDQSRSGAGKIGDLQCKCETWRQDPEKK